MSRRPVTVLKELKSHLPRGGRLLLAVSGGLDSVALLHGCLALQQKLGLVLEVAHVDHRLRNESARDATFVRRLAKQYGLPFHLKKADSRPGHGENLEAWARKLRYDFFAACLKRYKLDWVLTAHHADDLAETLLMRLVSNKELATIAETDEKRHLLRPLLGVTREALGQYAAEAELEFVLDQTNSDTTFLRNRVRHELIPLLRQRFDPRIVETLAERARALASDISLACDLCDPGLERLGSHTFGSRAWLRSLNKELTELPEALKWRFLDSLFKSKLGFSMGRRHALRLLNFLENEREGIELSSGVRLRRKAGGLHLQIQAK